MLAQTLTCVRRIHTRSNDRMHSVLLDHYGAKTDEHSERKKTLQHATKLTAATLLRCREATDCFGRQASASLLHSCARPLRRLHWSALVSWRSPIHVHQSMSSYPQNRVNAGFKTRFIPYLNYFEQRCEGKIFNLALLNYLTGKHSTNLR